MTKTEFAAAVSEKAGLNKKDAAGAVDAVLELIGDMRAEREARNPQDPTKTVHVPAKKVPAFKAGKELKAKVNQAAK